MTERVGLVAAVVAAFCASFRGGIGAGIAMMMVLPTAAKAYDSFPVAVLRALDKVTARVSTMEVEVGKPMRFGRLEFVARTCRKQPPEEPPESAVFLQVWELSPEHGRVDVFQGWMFASSPAVSAMDHPVYDIWVLDCVSSLSKAGNSRSGQSSE